MKIFIHLLTTLATICVLDFMFTALCIKLELPPEVSTFGALIIGFFGARIIYKWLSTEPVEE